MSSNAIAAKANRKQNARQTTSTFLMADFSPFVEVHAATVAAG
jgi:hypothetical protein